MISKKEFEAQSEALKQMYIKSLPAKRQTVKTTWNDLGKAGFNGEHARVLARLAHNLAGSGGLYGLPDISNAAMDIEILLSAAVAADEISPTAHRQLETLIARLDKALHETVNHGNSMA